MNKRALEKLICPICKKSLSLENELLRCSEKHLFYLKEGVPDLLPSDLHKDLKSTSEIYGKLWAEDFDNFSQQKHTTWHYEEMKKALPEQIVRGTLGLEIGCGNGFDSLMIANKNPNIHLCSIDISEGVFFGQHLKVKNDESRVTFLRASATDIPFQDNSFDFCYSFGVLHHLPDPIKGFEEMRRVLKPGAPFFLYLYEDHIENPMKYFSLKIVSWFRKFSKQLSPTQLKIMTTLLSPLVVLTFGWPSRLLYRFESTRPLAAKIPFNFGKGLFSVKEDLYDRFGAPFEHRFNQQSLLKIYHALSFQKPFFTKLPGTAGWVTMGYKSQ